MNCELCNREIKGIPYYNITEKKYYDMDCARLIELLKDEGFRNKVYEIIREVATNGTRDKTGSA